MLKRTMICIFCLAVLIPEDNVKKGFVYLFAVFIACSPLKNAQENFENHSYRKTITECKQVLAQDSLNTDAYTLMARSLLALDKPDSAQSVLESALKIGPKDQELNHLLTEALILQGDKAVLAGEDRIALNHYKAALQRSQPATLYEKTGDTYARLGLHERALELYQKAQTDSLVVAIVELKIDSLTERAAKARQYYEKGKKAAERQQFKSARELFSRALDLKPDYQQAEYAFHMAAGRYEYKENRGEDLWEAIEHFGRASSVYPDRGEPHYFLGLAYHKKDKDEYSNAISEFEIAAEKDPDGPYARKALKKATELRAHRKKMREFWGR